MQAGAIGVRVLISGRLNGADIARDEWLGEGNVPLHTFRSNISYASKVAITTYGTIGVKVWINQGDLTAEEEKKEEEPAKRRTNKKSRRTSLAQAAKASVHLKSSKKK